MKVNDLIERLQSLPADLDVYLSIDQEGNRFNELADVDLADILIEYEHGSYKEVNAVAPEDIGTEYDPDDISKAVILWP